MTFPLGRAAAAMLVLAGISGALLWLRPAPRPADLRVWVFDESHARAYRDGGAGTSLAEQFRQRTGQSVGVELLSQRALDVRLLSMFMSPPQAGQMPDLVEVEIGSIGRYLRAAPGEVGFLPLNDYLDRSGLRGRLVEQRLIPWSRDGVIFGVPHDVHPVTLTYRHDLFSAAGIDLPSARTWEEFRQACLAYQRYWRQRGEARRYALALPRASAGHLTLMLLQRGVNLVEEGGKKVRLSEGKVAETLGFYAQLVAGGERIAAEPGAGGLWAQDLAGGEVAAAITPDWQVADLRRYAPQLAGKVRMMPLPRFDITDAPTSTWGGTMVGIPRHAKDPEAAWSLLEFLYFSPAGLEARRRYSSILPADREAWKDPRWHEPDNFFGGQKIGELYVELAEQIPKRVAGPYEGLAAMYLSMALAGAVEHVEKRGITGLNEACLGLLGRAGADLQRQIEFGRLSE